MSIKFRTIPLVVAMVIFICITAPSFAGEQSEIYKNWRELAIRGYDPVAYHEKGGPVEGSTKYELKWKDALWRFASAEHRDLFKANPEKFAPRYGGYCAWAVSQGYTASTDPLAWTIVESKLYLNFNTSVKSKWEKDIPGNIKKADANWPGVLK